MARKPKQQRSKATVDAIVQAALISIASHGPSAITARQIAEKAGIGVGSLYEYFEDKDAIIDAASKRFVSDTVDLIKPLIPVISSRNSTKGRAFSAWNRCRVKSGRRSGL